MGGNGDEVQQQIKAKGNKVEMEEEALDGPRQGNGVKVQEDR